MKGYPTEVKTIGQHLKRRRIDLNLKQREVASRIGVHFASIQLWERGVGEPGVKQFPEIIRFLAYVPFQQTDKNGGRIGFLRQCAGLTQDELALAVGCNPGTIGRWEAGRAGKFQRQEKTVETLRKRLQSLGIEQIVRCSTTAGLQSKEP